MKNEKIIIYTYASKYSFEREFNIHHSTYKRESTMSEDEVVIHIGEIEVSIPVPVVTQEQLTNGEIDQLKAKIKSEQERSYKKQKFWKERISSLQAIESK